ncbi:MAG: hypothetical protein ACRDOE_03030 [Streptosporangiaceae bacterium]
MECARRGAAVLAAKFSPQHTSVQWSATAVRACAAFGALAAEQGRPSAPDRTGSVAPYYSLSSSPHAGERPAITVKRTAGGYASNWILDRVAAGAVLDLLPPAGTFSPGRARVREPGRAVGDLRLVAARAGGLGRRPAGGRALARFAARRA